VVAKGGGAASAEQLEELEVYFNGDQYSHPQKKKHLVANQRVAAVNYSPKVIDIEATVYGSSIERELIENRLNQVIQPEALKEDGTTYEWEFGAEVPMSRIIHEIFETSEGITRVDLAEPSSNVALQARELPVVGTVTLTIVEE